MVEAFINLRKVSLCVFIELTNIVASPCDCMATARDYGRHFPILALPMELRHAVYGYILTTGSRKVDVLSNYLEGRSVAKMRFYTTRDLSLLGTNKQIRIEAGNLFYAESVFTLYSYRRTQEYGQKPLYGERSFQISINRVRKCHLITPGGTAPFSHRDCLKGTQEFRILLQGVVDALAEGHCMRHLLVQSYQFERAVISEEQTMQCDITFILEPLENLRGLELCHIRAMKICNWPYLRFLERGIMRGCSERQDQGQPRRPARERALKVKEALKSAHVEDSFGDPDNPPNTIFEIFGIKPLYRDIDFLLNYEDDILI